MKLENRLYHLLDIEEGDNNALRKMSKTTKIPVKRLSYYNDNNILPCESDMGKIYDATKLTKLEVMLGMGILNSEILLAISKNYDGIAKDLNVSLSNHINDQLLPSFQTSLGSLYRGDCLSLLAQTQTESVDMVFADPPFNLDKYYASEMNDNLSMQEYLAWSEKWIDESIRVLKEGGSFFLWNIPKWNTYLSEYLNNRLSFRHWIAVDIKFSLQISGKLYPSHYSLLYYVKGEKPSSFNPDRLPMDVCKSCYREIKDYGGYKNKMNPEGINLTDVWYDIPPVRHSKYKKRKEANELSIKLLDRIIEMSTKPGDLIFDPFGGSGTTYIVAEMKDRKWLGIELGPIDTIIDRLSTVDEEKQYLNGLRENYNTLFTTRNKVERIKRGIWTDETFRPQE